MRDKPHLWTFVFLAMLFPIKYFYLYFVFLALIVLAYSFRSRATLNSHAQLALALIIYVFLGAFVRFYWFTMQPHNEYLARDFLEVMRFVPLALVFLYRESWQRLNVRSFFVAFLVYALVDAAVSVLQLSALNPLGVQGILARIFNAETQTDSSLLIAHRSLGLSANPGQHGVLMAIILVFMGHCFFTFRKRLLPLVGVVVSAVVLLTSQSQTAFLSGLLGIIALSLAFFNSGDHRQKVLSILLVGAFLVGFSLIVVGMRLDLRYLMTVFELGLRRSSYVNRIDKWFAIIGMSLERPLLYLIGHGKDYFGSYSTSMDSDYLYVGLVYGPFVLVVLILLVAKYVIQIALNLRRMIRSFFGVQLFCQLLIGVVIAWPAAFFIDPKTAIILALLMCARFWEHQRMRAASAFAGPEEAIG